MMSRYLYILCVVTVVSGCSQVHREQSPEPTVVLLPKSSVKIKKEEIIHEPPKPEYITIDGEEYRVPDLWLGRKLDAEPLSPPDLKQIPVGFTFNGSKLYLLEQVCGNFVRMADHARQENINLTVHSAYRSARYQRLIFKKLMTKGRSWDDIVRYVAPPGYSEHMLGKVVDLYPSNWRFAKTPEYAWLKKNAAEYGFSETYSQYNEEGFPWEPWHWKFEN